MRTVWLALGLCLAACEHHLAVHRVTAGNTDAPGVYYALPRTVVAVNGALQTTVTTASGCDAGYADQVGLKAEEPGTKVELTGLKLATLAEADPAQVFRVDIQSSPLTNVEVSFALSDQQTLTAATTDTSSGALDFTTQLLSVAGSVAGSVLKAFAAGAPDLKAPGPKPSRDEGRCALAVDAVTRVRGRRLDLITAAPADKETFSAAMAALDSLEARSAAVLAGTKSVERAPFECRFAPVSAAEVVLFPADKRTSGVTCTGADVKSQVAVTLAAQAVFGSSPGTAAETLPGMPYRIPAQARLTLKAEGKPRATLAKPVAQLGTVAYLPTAELETHDEFKLDGATGALLSFGGKHTSTSPNLKDFGDAATSVVGGVDAFSKGQAGAAAATDQAALDALDRQAKKLELEKKIRDLESGATP